MAINNQLDSEFLQALDEIYHHLILMQFEKYSFLQKGFAYFVQYKRENCIIEFIFGPPEYQVDMIIYTQKGKFSFKDLLSIQIIAQWINHNKYKESNERNLKNEILWFIELLKFSLPIVE